MKIFLIIKSLALKEIRWHKQIFYIIEEIKNRWTDI
jgi:hypothetical protein